MPIKIRESFVNATKGYRYGDDGWYKPFTDNLGELYRSLQREYGRCIGRVYIDMRADGKAGPVPVGWVFVQRRSYDDSPETYLRETWVEYRFLEGGAA